MQTFSILLFFCFFSAFIWHKNIFVIFKNKESEKLYVSCAPLMSLSNSTHQNFYCFSSINNKNHLKFMNCQLNLAVIVAIFLVDCLGHIFKS